MKKKKKKRKREMLNVENKNTCKTIPNLFVSGASNSFISDSDTAEKMTPVTILVLLLKVSDVHF